MKSSVLSPHHSAANLLAQKRRSPLSRPGSRAVLSPTDNGNNISSRSLNGVVSKMKDKEDSSSGASNAKNLVTTIKGNFNDEKHVISPRNAFADDSNPLRNRSGMKNTTSSVRSPTDATNEDSLMENPLRMRDNNFTVSFSNEKIDEEMINPLQCKIDKSKNPCHDESFEKKSKKREGGSLVLDYGGIYADGMDEFDNGDQCNGDDFGALYGENDSNGTGKNSSDDDASDSDDSSSGSVIETEAALLFNVGGAAFAASTQDLLEEQRADWIDYLNADSCDEPAGTKSVEFNTLEELKPREILNTAPATVTVNNGLVTADNLGTAERKSSLDSSSKLLAVGFQQVDTAETYNSMIVVSSHESAEDLVLGSGGESKDQEMEQEVSEQKDEGQDFQTEVKELSETAVFVTDSSKRRTGESSSSINSKMKPQSGNSQLVTFDSIYEGDVLDAEQTFLEAALSNDIGTMQSLLQSHPMQLTLCTNEEGQNALMLACKAGAWDVVKWLAPYYAIDPVSGGKESQSLANPARGIDKFGRTYLHLCKEARIVECICQSVLGKGAGFSKFSTVAALAMVNRKDIEGHTPLLTYAMAGNSSCLRALLTEVPTADLSISEPFQGRNCLHIAADRCDFEMVHIILSHCQKVSIELGSHASKSVLATDTSGRKLSMLGSLEDAAKQICRICDSDGNTPLHLAASATILTDDNSMDNNVGGSVLKVIMLLLNAGSDPNARNGRGVASLHFLCANSQLHAMAIPVAEVLCSLGADCNITDFDGCTPLLVACAYRQWSLCEFLLLQGGDLNQPCSVNSPFLQSGSDTLRQARRRSVQLNSKPSGLNKESVEYDFTAASADDYTSFSDYANSANNLDTAELSFDVNSESGCADNKLTSVPEGYFTASDLMPKAPRIRLFRCIAAPQTRIPGETRDRCMQCAAFFSGSESTNFYSRLGLVSGRHHCRLCQRVICSDCSLKEVSKDIVPNFVADTCKSSMVRVCNICYQILTDDDSLEIR